MLVPSRLSIDPVYLGLSQSQHCLWWVLWNILILVKDPFEMMDLNDGSCLVSCEEKNMNRVCLVRKKYLLYNIISWHICIYPGIEPLYSCSLLLRCYNDWGWLLSWWLPQCSSGWKLRESARTRPRSNLNHPTHVGHKATFPQLQKKSEKPIVKVQESGLVANVLHF